MKLMSRELLNDMLAECGLIERVTDAGRRHFGSLDLIERRAVERSCEIIGETLSRLERYDPEAAARIMRLRDIIGFRDQIAHGYDKVDVDMVDRMIREHLPRLREEIAALLMD